MNRPVHTHLFLTGFMAAGKSTVGRELARLANTPFVDLDARIEAEQGRSIADIFAAQGEPGFRALERAALEALLNDPTPAVVALGGGALLQRQTRLRVLEAGVVVCLRAKPETLAARAAADGATRPLLRNLADVTTLLEQRETSYAEAHAVLDVDGKSVADLAQSALDIWRRNPVAVASGLQSYVVEVFSGGAPERLAAVLGKPSQVLTIIDGTVERLHGAGYRDALARGKFAESRYVLTPGEENKNPATIQDIWQHAQRAEIDRKAIVVGIGGGVATDIAGFAAATWLRGLPWISMPTTLLGMVDASVGGKTAVDLGAAKNCIGAFWQPQHVLCDVTHLATESVRGFRSGLAEVVKTALLGDVVLLDLLERRADTLHAGDTETVTELVRRCVRVKASVVSRDPKEQGLRAVLNLGHTVGHALEAADGYGKLTHGEAVSLGLVAALKLGVHWGVTEPALRDRGVELLRRLHLPVDLESQPLDRAAELLGHDKKRGGKAIRYVLVARAGDFVFRDVPLPELQDLTRRLASL